MEDNLIINVGRQIGSGGRVIAKLLAETFGCQYYDREILCMAAKESGISEKFFEQNDEQKGFFHSLFHMHAPHMSDSSFYGTGMSQEELFKMQSDAIRKAAEEGSCVFVGRCADYVLRDFRHVTNVFITADMEQRTAEVMKRLESNEETAQKHITNHENERAKYYNFYTGKTWGHSASYDLCINSSLLGIEGTADFIAKFVRKREGI